MRSAWYLLLPLFVSCSGQNVVAGDEKTKPEQLAESLPEWCEQYCGTLNACNEGRPCDCAGDSCRCVGVDVVSCTAQCQKELRVYTLGAERCAELGQRFTGCLEKLSCEDLFRSAANDCEPTSSERAVCPDDGDEPSDEIPSQIGGSTSTAGSASISHGTAGSAYGLPGEGGAPSMGGSTSVGGSASTGGTGPTPSVHCKESHGLDGPPNGGVECDEGRLDCTDGHAYSWLCARGANLKLVCSCLVDAELTQGFEPNPGGCPTLSQVNAGCGFALQQ